MSLTLLSDSLITRANEGGSSSSTLSVKNEEKNTTRTPHTYLLLPLSFGLNDDAIMVVAASCFAACEEALRSSKIQWISRIEMSPMVQNIVKIRERDGPIRFAIKSDNFNDAHL